MYKIMHKIKKSSWIVCVIIMLCMHISAKASDGESMNSLSPEIEGYYMNNLGLTLSESEYNNLIMYVDEYTIDTLSMKDYEYIKENLDTCFQSNDILYVKSTYDKNGNDVLHEEYMTESEMLDSINNKNVSTYALSDRTDTVTTEMKKIVMRIYNVNASSRTVTLTCEWLSIPKIKSYDVIAFKFATTAFTIDFEDTDNVLGVQRYDGKQIIYEHDSDNIKYFNNGLGVSMNIVDSTSSSLSCTFTVTFGTNINPSIVYGSYQHAVSNVTLAESQDYTLHYWGLGNVIYFDDSIIDEYDNTPGLEVAGSIYDQ